MRATYQPRKEIKRWTRWDDPDGPFVSFPTADAGFTLGQQVHHILAGSPPSTSAEPVAVIRSPFRGAD
jgi:hypothetical protein